MKEPILEIRGLNKRFGPTHANKNIDFTLYQGEIRGLIGKTARKIHPDIPNSRRIFPDSGEMRIRGEKYCPQSPLDAYKQKISMVLQELGVVGNLPVGVNVFSAEPGSLQKRRCQPEGPEPRRSRAV